MIIANMVPGNESLSYIVKSADGKTVGGSLKACEFDSVGAVGNAPYTVEFTATLSVTTDPISSADVVVFYNYDWNPPYKVAKP